MREHKATRANDGAARGGPSPEELGRQSLRRFIVCICLVMVTTLTLLTYYQISRSRKLVIDSYLDTATSVANSFITANLSSEAWQDSLTGPDYAAFDREIKERIDSDTVLKIKLWNQQGKVVYSTDDKVVGRVFPIQNELEKAFQGKFVTQITEPDDAEHLREERYRELIKIYVPVYEPDSHTVIGVYEAYLTSAPLNETSRAGWLLSTLSMAVLLGVILVIMLFASRMMGRQDMTLRYLGRHLKILTDTDELTSLANHRRFHEHLDDEIARAARYRRPLSLIFVDLDRFKAINDRYGYEHGDKLLISVGAILNKDTRRMDFSARYGGDEFALVLPEIEAAEAINLAERLREVVSRAPVRTDDGQELLVNISVGVADYPSCGQDKESLVSAANEALLAAKKSGGNRVFHFRELRSAKVKKRDFEEEVKRICGHLQEGGTPSLVALAAAVDMKDQYDESHARQAEEIVKKMGSQMELNPFLVETLRVAAKVHDIGKLVIPMKVLQKQGSLTNEEIKHIRQHPEVGKKILECSGHMHHLLPALLYHHERYDGRGYPFGLKGEEIPLTARILHLIDAYQAMIANRPYKRALTPEEAAEELKRCAGSQFDSELVDQFLLALDITVQAKRQAPAKK